MRQPAFRDVFQAAANWNNAGGNWPQLESYLRMDFSRLCYLVHEGRCDEELSKKVHAILGPHSKTIVKAYIARSS